MGTQTSVKHARSWRQACTIRRDRVGELMAEDDDQRQVERMMSRTTADVESEIPCPETGEEVDVGEPSVQPQSVLQPTNSHSESGWIIRLRNPIRSRFERK